jgi:hypothetical protein
MSSSKSSLLKTNVVHFRGLLSNGVQYSVPAYQRDYSWTKENWEDLWEDLLEVKKTGNPHYMGAIVLTERGQDDFLVIDGQQRLATLSILVVAALRCLRDWGQLTSETWQKDKRIDLLKSGFLGGEHPVTLQITPKLKLNSTNRRFYEGTILQLSDPVSVPGLPPSERLLWDAVLFFTAKIEAEFGSTRNAEDLAQFVFEQAGTLLNFIQVTVDDEAGAYTVFETLNARGMELTAGDLLKNYLLSIIHSTGEGQLTAASELWKDISNRVSSNHLPEFLRHYLNSRIPFVRKDRVYKSIKSQVTTPSQGFALLKELEAASILIEALDDPTSSFWTELQSGRTSARKLKLYRVTQYRPLAIAAFRSLKTSEFERVLHAIDIVSFRYNIIAQRNTNELEFIFNRLAIRISEGELKSGREVQNALMTEAYVPDEEFREAFAKRSFPLPSQQNKLVKHILLTLQRQTHKLHGDWETDPATIEHVLPKHPAESWFTEFSDQTHPRYVDRLGNFLLLESKLNSREAANQSFASKCKVYAQSQYPDTAQLQFSDWNPAVIDSRQEKMAKTATACWRLEP